MSHHIWRLAEAGPGNLGLAVSEDGLLLGRTFFVERCEGRFVARKRKDIERLLSSGHQPASEHDAVGHRFSAAKP